MVDIQISKNIVQEIDFSCNEDETYSIKVKDDYSLSTSLMKVYDEIKNLLDILTNQRGKFYYKIESLISYYDTVINKTTIGTIKTFAIKHPSDLFEFTEIICMLSRDFKKIINAKIINITIKIYYDYNKVKHDFDSGKNYLTCIDLEDFKKEFIKIGAIPIKYINEPLIFRRK